MDVPISNLLDERVAVQRQQAHWQAIVKDLADQFACPLSEVEKALGSAEHQLEQGARIKVFVSLLAIKQVKELYQHTPRRHEPPDLNPPSPHHY